MIQTIGPSCSRKHRPAVDLELDPAASPEGLTPGSSKKVRRIGGAARSLAVAKPMSPPRQAKYPSIRENVPLHLTPWRGLEGQVKCKLAALKESSPPFSRIRFASYMYTLVLTAHTCTR